MEYKRLDDSQMEKQFEDKQGIIRTRPSQEDYNNTIDCAKEPSSNIPTLEVSVAYKQSISDYLHARGMVPSKTTYEVKIENYLQKGKNSVTSKTMSSDLGATVSETENIFMRINNLSMIKAEAVYTIIAKSKDKTENLPREIYLPVTYLGKRYTK
jgi:hypothetical protein